MTNLRRLQLATTKTKHQSLRDEQVNVFKVSSRSGTRAVQRVNDDLGMLRARKRRKLNWRWFL